MKSDGTDCEPESLGVMLDRHLREHGASSMINALKQVVRHWKERQLSLSNMGKESRNESRRDY